MYWDNKGLPHNCLIISLIFIENQCFSDGIWNVKIFVKRRIRTQVALYVKVHATHVLPSAPLELTSIACLL